MMRAILAAVVVGALGGCFVLMLTAMAGCILS